MLRLNRFKMGTRIFAGFAILIALTLGVAAFGTLQFASVERGVGKMAIFASRVQRVQEAVRLLDALRRAETEYRLSGDPAVLDARKTVMDNLKSVIAEASQGSASAERHRIYEDILTDLKAHQASFDQYAASVAIAARSVESMSAAGDDMAKFLANLVDSARAGAVAAVTEQAANVQASFLLVHIASLRFQAAGDEPAKDMFREAASKAKAALKLLEQSAGGGVGLQAVTVRSTLVNYEKDFTTFADSRLNSGNLYTQTLVPQLAAIQQKLSTAVASFNHDYDESGRVIAEGVRRASWLQQAFAGLALVLGAGIAVLLGRSITRPMTAMTAAMTRLAGGDRSIAIPARDGRDEMADMARAVDVFLQQAIENAKLAAERDREHAVRDRRQKTTDHLVAGFGRSVAAVMDSFAAAAAAMRKSASDVAEGSRQTRSSTSSTVDGAAISSRDLNSVAAAAEQMAHSIAEISQQVAQVTRSVQAAVERTAETDAKVAGLSETAGRIDDVVQLITGIAGQTNLLALNATIEAARAGEAGRGFAVVAGEVKALAAQTARATEQIGTQILAIRASTGEAVSAVRHVTTAIGAVEHVASAIAAAVEQQAAATREISNRVQQVTATTSSAVDSMRQVLEIAEATDTSSASALQAAEEVGRSADTLNAQVASFLAAIADTGEDARAAA